MSGNGFGLGGLLCDRALVLEHFGNNFFRNTNVLQIKNFVGAEVKALGGFLHVLDEDRIANALLGELDDVCDSG
ncbi:MAG: hypothetical protein QHJ82_10320 [Verrucomicrobiota bacterium]|nr:hypothetical protein [Verrucomicrobiota bacterium]